MGYQANDVHLSDEASPIIWASQLKHADFSVLPDTVRCLDELTTNDRSDSHHLVNVIRHDPAFALKILQEAARVGHFDQETWMQSSTLSQAVVVLGYDRIKRMIQDVDIVDIESNRPESVRYLQCALQAYHAAVNAEGFIREKRYDRKKAEQIFIATLLHRIGELAFWCHSNPYSKELSVVMSQHQEACEQAQVQVLGFKLCELSERLANQWCVNNCLSQSFSNDIAASDPVNAINIAEHFTTAIGKGWKSSSIQRVTKEVASFLERDIADTAWLLRKQHDEVVEEMNNFVEVTEFKIVFEDPADIREELICRNKQAEAEQTQSSVDKDAMLKQRLALVEKVISAIEHQPDPKVILRILAKAIARFCSANRIVIMMFSPGTDRLLTPRLVIRDKNDMTNFNIDLTDINNTLVKHVLDENKICWVNDQTSIRYVAYSVNSFRKKINSKSFFMAPLGTDKQKLGVILADSSQPDSLSAQEFQLFSQLVIAANTKLIKLYEIN